MRRTKLMTTLVMLAFSLTLMTFGVFAATSHSLSVDNYISFTIGDNIAFSIEGVRNSPSGNVNERAYTNDSWYNSTLANGGSAIDVAIDAEEDSLEGWNVSTPVVTLLAGERITWTFTIINKCENPIYISLNNFTNPWGENATLTYAEEVMAPTGLNNNGAPTEFVVTFQVSANPTFKANTAQQPLSFGLKFSNESETSQNSGYNIVNGKVIEYTGSEVESIIPNTATEIAANGFGENNTLTQVTIPSSVTKVDVGALSDITTLETIIFEGETAPIIQTEAIPDIVGGSSALLATSKSLTSSYSSSYAGETPVTVVVPENSYNDYVLELYASGFNGNVSNGTTITTMASAVETVSEEDNWYAKAIDNNSLALDWNYFGPDAIVDSNGYVFYDYGGYYAFIGYFGEEITTLNIPSTVNGMEVKEIHIGDTEVFSAFNKSGEAIGEMITRIICPQTVTYIMIYGWTDFDSTPNTTHDYIEFPNLKTINIPKDCEYLFIWSRTLEISITRNLRYVELYNDNFTCNKNNPYLQKVGKSLYTKQDIYVEHDEWEVCSARSLIYLAHNDEISTDPNVCTSILKLGMGSDSRTQENAIVDLVIPENVNYLYENCFYNEIYLSSVTVLGDLDLETNIGLFAHCYNLRYIDFSAWTSLINYSYDAGSKATSIGCGDEFDINLPVNIQQFSWSSVNNENLQKIDFSKLNNLNEISCDNSCEFAQLTEIEFGTNINNWYTGSTLIDSSILDDNNSACEFIKSGPIKMEKK